MPNPGTIRAIFLVEVTWDANIRELTEEFESLPGVHSAAVVAPSEFDIFVFLEDEPRNIGATALEHIIPHPRVKRMKSVIIMSDNSGWKS